MSAAVTSSAVTSCTVTSCALVALCTVENKIIPPSNMVMDWHCHPDHQLKGRHCEAHHREAHHGEAHPQRQRQSSFAPEILTTFSYLSYSDLSSRANSSGVMYMGSSDWDERLEATAGSATARFKSAFSLSTIVFGVPAGTKVPIHEMNS